MIATVTSVCSGGSWALTHTDSAAVTLSKDLVAGRGGDSIVGGGGAGVKGFTSVRCLGLWGGVFILVFFNLIYLQC